MRRSRRSRSKDRSAYDGFFGFYGFCRFFGCWVLRVRRSGFGVGVWKLARIVRREVVRLTRRGAGRGNVAEGWSRFRPAEIVYFLGIAKASLDETEDEMLDGHKARIEREIQLGLRRSPKDPASRPWRRQEKPGRVKPSPGEPGT